MEIKKSVEQIFYAKKPDDTHPFCLNQVHRAIGYSTLGNAKQSLKQGFRQDEDFILLMDNHKQDDENSGLQKHGGHNAELIYLTMKCFIRFSIQAKTNIGKAFNRADL